MELIQSIDFSVLDFIREHLNCRFLDIFLGIFTTLGNGGIVWIALTVGLLRRLGCVMAIGLAFCLLTGNLFLKLLIARDRPFIVNPDIILAISPPSGYSFPSGHSYSSFISAVIMAKYSRKLAAAAIPAAVLIAFSRLYFYVHFPTDVLAGTLMGIIFGLVIYKICDGRRIKMVEKVKGICEKAVQGKISPESFYDTLRAVADDTRTDDDLACLLEDVLMEIEMEHDGNGGAKAGKRIIKEAAERLLEEME